MLASLLHCGLLTADPMIQAADPPKTFRTVQLGVIHPRANPCPCPCRGLCQQVTTRPHRELGQNNIQSWRRTIVATRRQADMGPEIFSLNVGGRKFTTSRETVCKVWREPSLPLEVASRSQDTR